MASDVTCEKLRENAAELALGVLFGRERAEAVEHLERCADCREYVENLTLAGDRLIGLLPFAEPPAGFETRAARRLAQDAAAHEGRSNARASAPAHHGLGGRARRARLRLASVAAAAAVACGLAGWGIGTAVEQITASAPPAVESEPVLVGDLTSPQGAGPEVGEVYAHPGTPGWFFMTVDLVGPDATYTGKVTCLLEHADGTSVRVGDFALRDGHGNWGAEATVDPAALSGARVTTPDGTVLATAELQIGHVQTPAET
ncbi:hypothetical protein ACIRU3_18125 [Streptomyces sp. NPDC101151]|uniref:hypothetical protein n=1 Tax=Streptomyces sp. NPDC101151 TaxID=3366115 RepID=UPI0038001282